ncbi:sulfur carrier protein ThiS [Undibacterium cyanobacteriorum]|uniref:Sulfur carrier protein ThiS n=1 Tax=Undibacterium cyanobacteriorum TaxID=3073561 RepID=A0ABY9RIN2_9BURK|nr:sulfur carrier protein ThiS [Undibacterium sp. 20NA77.5]WMW80187.1 sulfur carrier protein ThiS [Undibacterium sp. 20NA77.5]
MEIQINGETKYYPSELNLQSLIAELNIGNQAIAVAVNRDVISRSQWAECVLRTGDVIDVVRAIGGG